MIKYKLNILTYYVYINIFIQIKFKNNIRHISKVQPNLKFRVFINQLSIKFWRTYIWMVENMNYFIQLITLMKLLRFYKFYQFCLQYYGDISTMKIILLTIFFYQLWCLIKLSFAKNKNKSPPSYQMLLSHVKL